jgi:choline dehydrogenase
VRHLEGPYHGGNGPLTVRAIEPSHLLHEPLRESARAAGYTINDDYDAGSSEGFARGDVTIDPRGRRMSTARAYLLPVRSRPNLRVITGALAQRIVVAGGRASGVQFRRNGAVQQARARREVILAGGTYNSPQLLMLSGIGPGAELARHGIAVVSDLAGVGRNLIEHPRMPLLYRASLPVTFTNQLRLDRAVLSVLRWGLTGRGPFANQICSGTLLLKSDPSLDRPDVQLLCNPVQLDAHLWFPGLIAPKPHGFYITVCQLYAKSRGSVTLRSADADDAPRIAFNLFSESSDFDVMRRAVRAARALYRTQPQAGLTAAEMTPGAAIESDADLDDVIRQLAGITHHPVGTCAMGAGPGAVVDPQLRVRGIDGLRVADASIMPAIVGGNTNAATIMIGEKAADLILGRRLAPAVLERAIRQPVAV